MTAAHPKKEEFNSIHSIYSALQVAPNDNHLIPQPNILSFAMFQTLVFVSLAASAAAFAPRMNSRSIASKMTMQGEGLKIDMRGKTVFIGGVADSTGYGWAIAKACAEAGAKILLGTWPPVLPIFQMGIERGQFEEDSKLSDGSTMEITKVCFCLVHSIFLKTFMTILPIVQLIL